MLNDENDLPTGVVTFLFTDIEGSTVRWERAPTQMRAALARHNAILREAIERSGGFLYQTAGDSFVAVFVTARPALETAIEAQCAFRDEAWPAEIGSLRVRMALHTGTATRQAGTYEANHALTRHARLLATAHGDQILVSAATRELLVGDLPDGVRLRDLGSLRLKNLVDPQRVFQVVASVPPWSLPDDFPPPLGQRSHPGNIPVSPLPFIGRAAAVSDVSRAITEGPLRLTTLLGPGGIGKTRLALRTAERMQHHFADGAFIVDLAAVTEVDLVIPTIGSTLGLPDADEQTLSTYLSSRELLLVLDNLEQVIDAATEVAKLLAAAPSLRVLATSRVPLRLLGEYEYEVAPLELPDLSGAAEDVESYAQAEAVALFVERAKAARRDFELTSTNVRCIGAICHRLDGIPLALLLAAARLRDFTPEEMLAVLDRRLALLTGGARDLPGRHQTLRDTIEWSYELLDADQQAQYATWSIFVGGFEIDAAAALHPQGRGRAATLDDLRLLVDNSLLVATSSPDGEVRYRMLETINEHAVEKLTSLDAATAVQRAHARHYLALAEEAVPHLEGEQLAWWSGRLEEEHDNFRSALSGGFERSANGDPESVETVVRTATALALFWHDRGHFSEGRSHLEAALTLVPAWIEAAGDQPERERALAASAVMSDYLGTMARRRGDLIEAQRCLERALKTYRALDDERGQGRALAALGSVFFCGGDFDAAREAQTLSIELSRSNGDGFNVAGGLLLLGNIERDSGNGERARACYRETLDVCRPIHDLVGVSVALNNLANLSLDEGDVEEARELHLQSLEIRHEVGYRIMFAESIVGVAATEVALGRSVRAARLLGFAEGLIAEVGATFDIAERRVYDRAMSALTDQLGSASLADERLVGRGMSDEAARRYAVDLSG